MELFLKNSERLKEFCKNSFHKGIFFLLQMCCLPLNLNLSWNRCSFVRCTLKLSTSDIICKTRSKILLFATWQKWRFSIVKMKILNLFEKQSSYFLWKCSFAVMNINWKVSLIDSMIKKCSLCLHFLKLN